MESDLFLFERFSEHEPKNVQRTNVQRSTFNRPIRWTLNLERRTFLLRVLLLTKCGCRRFMGPERSVTRVGVRHEVKLDVRHGLDEAVEALLGVVEERLAGDDELPLAVPDRARDEAVVGVLGALQSASCPCTDSGLKQAVVETGRKAWCLRSANRGSVSESPDCHNGSVEKPDCADVERQRDRQVLDAPGADRRWRRPGAGCASNRRRRGSDRHRGWPQGPAGRGTRRPGRWARCRPRRCWRRDRPCRDSRSTPRPRRRSSSQRNSG